MTVTNEAASKILVLLTEPPIYLFEVVSWIVNTVWILNGNLSDTLYPNRPRLAGLPWDCSREFGAITCFIDES